MLCYVRLCYVMLCDVMLCYVISYNITLYHIMLYHVVLCHITLYYILYYIILVHGFMNQLINITTLIQVAQERLAQLKEAEEVGHAWEAEELPDPPFVALKILC